MAPILKIPLAADRDKLLRLLFVRLWSEVFSRFKPSPPVDLIEDSVMAVMEIVRLDGDISRQFYKAIFENLWREFVHLADFNEDEEFALAVARLCQLMKEKKAVTFGSVATRIHDRGMAFISPDQPQWKKYEEAAELLLAELDELVTQIVGWSVVRSDRPTYTLAPPPKPKGDKNDT